jgi:hypothetical protein
MAPAPIFCRQCHRLAFPSQLETRYERLCWANDIRMRLGGEPGLASASPERPKGMHQRAYEPFRSEVWQAEMHAEERLTIFVSD